MKNEPVKLELNLNSDDDVSKVHHKNIVDMNGKGYNLESFNLIETPVVEDEDGKKSGGDRTLIMLFVPREEEAVAEEKETSKKKKRSES